MDIKLSKLGKRYRYEWIFRDISCVFEAPKKYAVLGPNGSGKSTLLKTLSGHLTPSKGNIEFLKNDQPLERDSLYLHVSYAAPYIEVIEEFTLLESLNFHQKFKTLQKGLTSNDIIDLLEFEKSKHKAVKFFSSGMKQRLKLALAICSETPLLLLDEPTTNLDAQGVDWYLNLVEQFTDNRLVIVASNIKHDYGFCTDSINILDYKKKNASLPHA